MKMIVFYMETEHIAEERNLNGKFANQSLNFTFT